MGYLHIENLYKNQTLLMFKEVFCLEKVHGSSAHVSWRDGQIRYSGGGVESDQFKRLFDQERLLAGFQALGHPDVTVYGERYGGKEQGMSYIYGKEQRFIAFDVQIGETWLNVPNAEDVATKLGLEFVPYERITTDLEAVNAQRDRPSVVAQRRGMGDSKQREGVVLRPLIELTDNRGNRLIVKHRIQQFSERATEQKVIDPAQLLRLQEAQAIADEWVVPNRLQHVLQKLPPNLEIKDTGTVIKAMVEDVYREAKGEIVESKEAQAAISRKAADLFKAYLKGPFK